VLNVHVYKCFSTPVIAQYKPTDATTNPSLLYAAAQQTEYDDLVQEAITFAKGQSRYSSALRPFTDAAWSKGMF